MTKDELYSDPNWQFSTFEGAELSVLLRGLETTFREKLEWLEEAETLTLRIREARKMRDQETRTESPNENDKPSEL